MPPNLKRSVPGVLFLCHRCSGRNWRAELPVRTVWVIYALFTNWTFSSGLCNLIDSLLLLGLFKPFHQLLFLFFRESDSRRLCLSGHDGKRLFKLGSEHTVAVCKSLYVCF